MNDNELIFASEEPEYEIISDTTWSVLIIDDDHEVHAVTKLALHDFQFDNKKLNLVSAYNSNEAKEILSQNNDFSFVLLDIVMESNDAGIKVIEHIRNELDNKLIRIIIRTGQPGYAPEEEIINLYDINDYKEKTELTTTKLYTTARTALAQYKQLSELQKKTDELYHHLITDPITNLYSREKLYQDLEKLDNVGLLLIDIDSFSTINNAYGYTIGDSILKKVAKILNESNLDTKLMYRIESDNFVLLYQNKSDDFLLKTALKIKNVLVNKEFNIDDLTLLINISIGIANNPHNNLLQKAEIAVFASRQKQDNKIEFYSEELNTIKVINNNLLWSKRLTKAINSDNIITYFQPIVECKTQKIVKYETLVRLVYEDEVYSPFHFLGAARNAGLLTQITKIVFEQACKKFENNDLDFSVNITDHDLMNTDFANMLMSYCEKYNIQTNRISLEILEEESISKNIQALKNLTKLRELGFLLSIDDFGVEYSNFSQLKYLDIDSVKIDGSFIKDIDTNKYSKYVAQSILSYTSKINVKTVAEFVHSKEVFEEIKELGIDYAQGYYFGKPESELK
ncbi:EAL domain-containing protein [Poseidonibacter lekithochrous]|uniref:two-component system response regulator n=1 Tax=Poseidonibacter lekithochrous TaxID=1904463 RepID=UPI0008FCC834|nr:EAL domain-containing protein [Poseidonibacter lekithochrous]QKJ22453.1 response regulator receiver-modulated diguanylate cyclase/phosphodiesterase [Poseidonibacter lekithochrous]